MLVLFILSSNIPKTTFDDLSKLKESKKPVFIISKDFISGKEIKAGIFANSGITPYPALSQAPKLQEVTLNLAEVGLGAHTSKDNVKLCLQKIFREMLTIVKKVSFLPQEIKAQPNIDTKSKNGYSNSWNSSYS